MGSSKANSSKAKLTRSRLSVDWGMVRAGERVCVAVSGGADSTALLLSLLEANRPRTEGGLELGLVISAAHVHHGLRGAEADADEAFVQGLCERLDVPFRVFRVDTPARQQAQGEGPEEAARALRYAALWGLLREVTADVVATAHTLDDQAETVMMKLLRGAWTEGLGGISPQVRGAETRDSGKATGRVVRPMLGVRRSEVEAFLQERGQGWRNDASNQDLGLTRNRVRHQLMPLLREFNPNVDEALSRTAELARDEEAFWASELERVLPHVLLPGTAVRGGGRSVRWEIECGGDSEGAGLGHSGSPCRQPAGGARRLAGGADRTGTETVATGWNGPPHGCLTRNSALKQFALIGAGMYAGG
jgi:tRNA(Ile)-lysidine synthase